MKLEKYDELSIVVELELLEVSVDVLGDESVGVLGDESVGVLGDALEVELGDESVLILVITEESLSCLLNIWNISIITKINTNTTDIIATVFLDISDLIIKIYKLNINL